MSAELKYTVTIPCRSLKEAGNAVAAVWGGAMIWKDGKAWPIDDKNPCVIAKLHTGEQP